MAAPARHVRRQAFPSKSEGRGKPALPASDARIGVSGKARKAVRRKKSGAPREKLRCTEVEGRPASDALCLQYIIANTLSTTAARNEMVIFHGKRVCFEKTV